MAVQQRTLLYLLSEGSRVNRLWLGWVLSPQELTGGCSSPLPKNTKENCDSCSLKRCCLYVSWVFLAGLLTLAAAYIQKTFFISALEGALTHGLHRNDGTLGVLRANVGLAVGAQ